MLTGILIWVGVLALSILVWVGVIVGALLLVR